MTKKMAVMVIRADLQCPFCYKKIKKILGKYPPRRKSGTSYVPEVRPNVVVAENPAKGPEPVRGIPSVFPPMACYGPSYHGFGGGVTWYNWYVVPPPPQSTFDGYYGYGYGYP